MNLRDQIAKDISRAIDSTVNYSGKEYEENKHNWVQITTDRAIAAFVNVLPEPVDIEAKYELQPGKPPLITIKSEQEEEENQQQVFYLARYADDKGYNRYYGRIMGYLQALYTMPQDVVHSEHGNSKSRQQHTNSNEPVSEEPS